jgi:hypothetical protein
MNTKPINVALITCSKCLIEKKSEYFYKRGKICCDCNNEKRRQKYKNDEEYRKKLIQMSSDFKHEKFISL